jgi:hypothetical protein
MKILNKYLYKTYEMEVDDRKMRKPIKILKIRWKNKRCYHNS